jgi:hypothetical protein
MQKPHKDPFGLFELETRRRWSALRLLDIAQGQIEELEVGARFEERISSLQEALELLLASCDELLKVGFVSPYIDHRMSACECPEEDSLPGTRRSS